MDETLEIEIILTANDQTGFMYRINCCCSLRFAGYDSAGRQPIDSGPLVIRGKDNLAPQVPETRTEYWRPISGRSSFS
jgi:hypothetical protein